MSDIVDRLLKLREEGITSGEALLDYGRKQIELSAPNSSSLLDVIELGRLNWSPKVNWIEANGGLPKYIETVSLGIMKSGKTREQAIPIAISRIKRWAAGLDGVNKDTQAKSIKALAEWEAIKAKAKAKRLAKAGKK